MELTTKTEDHFCIITVQDTRIDAAVALRFKDLVRKASEGSPAIVVLDLSAVTFIDSSGLGSIVATMKLLAPDRKLVLAGLTPTVDKVFRLTRMDSVFELHGDVENAVSKYRGTACDL